MQYCLFYFICYLIFSSDSRIDQFARADVQNVLELVLKAKIKILITKLLLTI